MKMAPDDYRKFNQALMDTLKVHGLHPYMVGTVRHMWQCFHKACDEGRISLNELHAKYNDTHIETAMRKVFTRNGASQLKKRA